MDTDSVRSTLVSRCYNYQTCSFTMSIFKIFYFILCTLENQTRITPKSNSLSADPKLTRSQNFTKMQKQIRVAN